MEEKILPRFLKENYYKITNELSREIPAIRLSKVCYIGPVDNPKTNDFYNTKLERIFDISGFQEYKYIKDLNGVMYKPKFMIDDMAATLKYDKNILLKKNQRMFLFANIKSAISGSAVIRLGGGGVFKVWLNGICIFCGWGEGIDRDLILASIHRGDNSIIIEIQVSLDNNSLFSAQICMFNKESCLLEYPILNSYIQHNVKENFGLIDETCHVSLHETYCFMLRKKDYISEMDYKIGVKIKCHDTELEEFWGEFEKVYQIDCNRLRNYTDSVYVTICISLIKNEETLLQHKFPLFIRTIDTYFQDIIKRMQNIPYESLYYKYIMYMLNDLKACICELNIECETFIESSTKRIREHFIVNQLKNIQKCINNMEKEIEFKNIFYQEGIHDWYFNSYIDNTIKKMVIHVPKAYNHCTKYPLIMLILANNTSYMSESESNCLVYKTNINNLIHKKCIIACIPIRGFTMGSYMGDTAFFEALDLIKKQYNVDEDRIYLAGNSNGAYTAWALAQNHPDVFAAIVTDGGCPNKDNMKNVNHIPIMNIVGQMDKIVQNAYDIPTAYYKENNMRYEACLIKAGNHYTANAYFYKNIQYYINWLLQFKRVVLPKCIMFRTEKMLYNKSYYIEILKIENNKRFAEIKAQVIEGHICINTVNVAAFSIDLSQFKTNNIYKVYINEQTYDIRNKKKIILNKINHNYTYCRQMKKKYHRQGMGFLYIYINNFKIVLPSSCQDAIIKSLRTIADKCSEPASHAVKRKIDVKYDVVYDKECLFIDSNVFLIDYRLSNKLLRKQLDKLPIKLGLDGISYKDKELHGEYSIMCICTINNMEVAIISSNSLTHLETNFFLRNFIIPSYYNGFHKFLNNDAIIYNDQHYYTIYKWGDDIVQSL